MITIGKMQQQMPKEASW